MKVVGKLMKNNQDNRKHHLIFTTAALAAIPVAYVGMANHKFNKIFKTNKHYLEKDIIDFLPDEFTVEAYKKFEESDIDWYKQSNLHNCQIDAFDGLKLSGVLIENHRNHRYVILAHDYNEDCYALLRQAHLFDELNFNVLLIDLRGWGNSEGQYTTLGFKESLDILAWIDKLVAFDSNAEIGLYGVGMGASSCLLAAQHTLTSNVSFIISDCAYANAISYLEKRLNSNLYTNLIEMKVSNELNFDLTECNMLEAAAGIAIPVLFIHGTKDQIIPCQDTLNMYEACNASKELLILEDSHHGFNCYHDGFKERITNFIENL